MFFDLLMIYGSIKIFIKNMSNNNWVYAIFSFIIIIFFTFGFLIFFIKNIYFKKDFIKILKEYDRPLHSQTDGKVYYNDIKSVKFIKKNEEGPHIKGVWKNKNTIVFYAKKNKVYLFSAEFCTKKQIKNIIKETKLRANLNEKCN